MRALRLMLAFEKDHADEFAVEFDVVPLDAVKDDDVARARYHLEVAEHLSPSYVDWATVALFFSAARLVHSCLVDEPGVQKGHPRKHTAPATKGNGGRGANQMVRDLYPEDVHEAYRSLFELSRRKRYESDQLGGPLVWSLARLQYDLIEKFCIGRNAGRLPRGTQEP